MTKDELKDKIIEILKRRVQNLIASDLISPFFWEDFADEIMKKEQQLAECGKVCTCGNPSEEGRCYFEGDEKLIYICADCGKQVVNHE